MLSLRTETHDLGTRRRGRTRTIIGYFCDSTATCELLWRRRNHTRSLLLSCSQQQRWLCRSWVSTILLLLLGLHCVDLRGLSAQSSNSSSSLVDGGGGSWELLLQNAGIASMHTALTHFGTLVLLDRTDIGASLLNLPGNGAAPHSHPILPARASEPCFQIFMHGIHDSFSVSDCCCSCVVACKFFKKIVFFLLQTGHVETILWT